VAVVAAVAGCRTHSAATPTPIPAPAAPACPAPRLIGVEWFFVPDSTGFTLALPPGFLERPRDSNARRWILEGDSQQYMIFGTIRGELGLPGYRRVYQPTLMREYSECSDSVGAYQVSIQAWRTPDGVFRDFRRLDRYDVFAIWEVRSGVYAYLMGGTYSRPTQDLMLGAIRAWRPGTP
jgi:hypothetical protein